MTAGTVLAGAVAFGAYKLSAPTYRVARLALGWRPPAKMDVAPQNVTNHGSRAESRFAGSVETYMSMAIGQVAIGHYVDNEFRVSGSGFRFDVGPNECLVVPAHVWEEVVMRAGDRVTLRGKTADAHVSDSEVVKKEIYTDVFLVQLPPSVFSKIGVAKPNIGSLDKRSAAKLAGPAGLGTLGNISLSDRAFGMTYYEGTTLPGYSGAPYTVSGNIVAMHLRGADTQHGPNIGVSAQMLYVTAKKTLDLKLEDSEEWLVDQVTKRKKKMFIDQTWGHPDSMRVRIGNQFAIIEKETIASALGSDLDEFVDYIDFSDNNGAFESAGTASGNAQTPGVLLSLAEPQGLEPSAAQTSINLGLNDCMKLLQSLPEEEIRKIRNKSFALLQKRSPGSAITNGQAKTATT
uniref:Uncharacterized protein n=1 Tax=Solemoviridae sp. TaxID=2715208 RepID=A0A6M3YPR0_9VIRU|nr:MAG: hypothetical protein 1 [Solemoviridae sp.]